MNSLKAHLRMAAIVSTIALLSTLSNCAKKGTVVEDNAVPTAAGADESASLGDSDSGKAMGLQTIHFAYDSSKLDKHNISTLKSNAKILKDKSGLKVQIEGHCDQRGGIQYNLALGERRAKAVKHYLVDLGISADRLTTISFGKEKPLNMGSDEQAYAANRRANFVITAQ